MKRKIVYNYAKHLPLTPCCAMIKLDDDITVYGYGFTFDEAREKAIYDAKALPPSEEIDI